MNNMLILEYEPFIGFRPDDVRKWLKDYPTEENLALALSTVNVKSAYVWDEYEDSNDQWALYAAEEWSELERFITRKIEEILEAEAPDDRTHPEGSIKRLLPFMERNGYRNGSGWWIKEDKSND